MLTPTGLTSTASAGSDELDEKEFVARVSLRSNHKMMYEYFRLLSQTFQFRVDALELLFWTVKLQWKLKIFREIQNF